MTEEEKRGLVLQDMGFEIMATSAKEDVDTALMDARDTVKEMTVEELDAFLLNEGYELD